MTLSVLLKQVRIISWALVTNSNGFLGDSAAKLKALCLQNLRFWIGGESLAIDSFVFPLWETLGPVLGRSLGMTAECVCVHACMRVCVCVCIVVPVCDSWCSSRGAGSQSAPCGLRHHQSLQPQTDWFAMLRRLQSSETCSYWVHSWEKPVW